ncbi:MAG: hypothetical protein Q9M28_11175 [Mariprofundaceae bacterium]|nr:hypothetical protein [Mariprofundaceae bacterium]
MHQIAYKEGYKYQIVEPYSIQINIKPNANIGTSSDFISLSKEGLLTLKTGYAWDGPSGLEIDTLNFMRSSLVHDALYQLMREGKLDKNTYRQPADQLLCSMGREDGVSALRAYWVYYAIRLLGDKGASPRGARTVIHAP